jgi:hypothetical protein
LANCGWLWNDGSFIAFNDGGVVLTNEGGCSDNLGGNGDANAAGGYAKAWDDHWKAKARRDKRRAELLDLIRASDDYRRLQRKLRMLNEHLLDSPDSLTIKERIRGIEDQIEMMERM